MWKTNWILHILADLNLLFMELFMELFLDQNSNANGCKTTGTLFLHKCILHTNWLLCKVFYVLNLLQLACTVHGSVLLQTKSLCTEDQLLFELCLAPVLNLEQQLQQTGSGLFCKIRAAVFIGILVQSKSKLRNGEASLHFFQTRVLAL